ncbi:MAG: hypothetical protein IPK76_08730 [Lewinellaceae bacterium]|nr:hypothetical protein [Lewinellaceae bacterium]
MALLPACRRKALRKVTPAFYYWKTTLSVSADERNYLDRLNCKKLYVKWLDIGRDDITGAVTPYALLEITDTSALSGLAVIPTVFITNAVFRGISGQEMEQLADNLKGSLGAFVRATGKANFPEEIQFDCDWTASTREAYFLFLQKIKNRLPPDTRISATIRLHQYKFPGQTGVPPADRGMLMFYNTGDVDDPAARNSIFRMEDAGKYVEGAPKTYPLPLDLALPVFSWLLVYREDALWKIIPDIPDAVLADTLRFMPRQHGPGQSPVEVYVRSGTFMSGHYLRPGDLLRQETITPALLLQATELASQTHLADETTVAFFHLDEAALQRYPVQLLDTVCQMICLPEMKKH